MSSCLSGGGGRTYRFDFEFAKATSTSTKTSQSSSSPSSTISESSYSPLAISTRKARTPRKRPNQIYNEAAALLSTAYPKIFPTKGLTTKPRKFTKPTDTLCFDDSPEMLFPFRVIESSEFLLHQPIQDKPSFQIESKVVNFPEKLCHSPGEIISGVNFLELGNDCEEDFDAESILDEEVEEGIDSIMGNRADDDSNAAFCQVNSSWYGNTVMGFSLGGKFDYGCGFRRSAVSALRNVDDGNWWRFPTVDIRQISPKLEKSSPLSSAEKKKKKHKKVEKPKPKPKPKPEPEPEPDTAESKDNDMVSELDLELSKQNSKSSGLQLNLDYNGVLKAWSGRGSPFSDESIGSHAQGNDINARLAQIDLLLDSGGVREASVMRYKEKRRTRLFSKKIRYQVRKVNADQRPRMKGRFVRRPNSNTSSKRVDNKAKAKEHSLRDILLFH